MISSTSKSRVPSRKLTQKHIQGIQIAARERRKNCKGVDEIRIGLAGAQHGDYEQQGSRIRAYFNQLNADILWAQYKQRDTDVQFFAKKLAQKLERDLSFIWQDLILFLTSYQRQLVEIDIEVPLPVNDFINSNYSIRRKKLEDLKSDGKHRIEELLQEVK